MLAASSQAASTGNGQQGTETAPAETEPPEEGEAPGETEAPPTQAERQKPDQPISVLRELPELRTEKSDTYLRSDGSRAQRIYAWPVNYPASGGGWHPIEDQLIQSGDGTWQPEASPVPISFPASLASGPVSVGSGDRQLSFQLQGASTEEGAPGGVVRTYRDALPSTDIAYAATAQAVRETLTLRSSSAPSEYRYSVSLSQGLRASAQPDGRIEVDGTDGKPLYWIAAPSVSDAATDRPFPSHDPVHYELSDDGSVLTLVVDKAWLSDPQRVFPVKIDPEVYFTEAPACPIIGGSYANKHECGSHLYVGPAVPNPAEGAARSLLYFDTSCVPKGSVIVQSSLRMFFSWDTTSSPITIEAHALTRSFTTGVTWNKYDGTNAWTTPGGDFKKTVVGERVFNDSETGKELHFGFTPQVEQWVRDPESNHGILLKAQNEAKAGYDAFAQAGNSESAPEPALEVIYEPRLGIPPMGQVFQQGLAYGSTMGVNVANGNLTVSAPDINFATEGYDTELGRSYNSQDDLLEGASLGNWRLNKGDDTKTYGNEWDGAVDFYGPDGGDTRFDRAPWADGHPASGDRAFTGEAGYNADLKQHEGGSRTLTFPGGVEWKFDNKLWGIPTEIVDPGGVGSTMSLTYLYSRLSEVTDTHGHKLKITRDETTHNITKIEAKKGEVWKYAYKEGRLVTYTNQVKEKAKYTYYKSGIASGLLESIADTSGTWVVVYDEQHRVTSLRKLVNGTIKKAGSEDEITTFSYETEQTTVTNPEGVKPVYYYDQFGNAVEEPATQEIATEFYASYAGIEAEAARKAVDLQDHASILDSQISQQLGPAYVGEWFDPTSEKPLKLGITAEGYERTVEQDLDNLGLSDNAEVVTETHPWIALESAYATAAGAIKTLKAEGLVSITITPNTDGLLFTKANSLNSSQSSEVAAAAGSSAVPTVIREEASASLLAEPDSCSEGACSPPLRGGVLIEQEELIGGTGCTSGFVARNVYTSKPYLVTAGHCIFGGHGPGSVWETPEPGTFGGNKIGPGSIYFYGSHHSVPGGTTAEGDAGLIEVSSSSPFYSRGLAPWVVEYGTGSHKGTVANEHYVISGTHYNPEHESQTQFMVCAGGVSGGGAQEEERCGMTEGFEPEAPYHGGPVVHNLERVNLCNASNPTGLKKGASGSPVYKGHDGVGIYVASSGKNDCTAFYEGINRIEYDLHVHILKG